MPENHGCQDIDNSRFTIFFHFVQDPVFREKCRALVSWFQSKGRTLFESAFSYYGAPGGGAALTRLRVL